MYGKATKETHQKFLAQAISRIKKKANENTDSISLINTYDCKIIAYTAYIIICLTDPRSI